MKTQVGVVALFAALLLSSTARASVTGASWWDDWDGALVCSGTNWNAATGVLSMSGNQYWGPGHMVGTIDTSGPEDPMITLASGIENDTNFTWTSYIVNVYMSSTFTLTNAAVTLPIDWTIAGTVEPSSPLVSGPYAGDYEASLTLAAGTPVAVGDELDFQYQLKFSGSSHFAFTQEVIPVPEPGAIEFATLGGLMLAPLAFARRSRRTPKA
ncbi:MAG TPA: hypothetical protein VMP11_05990 [Verrucomicrobiae bacterium]|nr:hypothetical protein [Verrucomicrobiae bacterium]